MVTLLVLGAFLLAIFDAVIISAFVVNVIKKFLGETPHEWQWERKQINCPFV